MSTACPNEIGPPSVWLASAGLERDRRACAIPLGLNCGSNDDIIDQCCLSATGPQNSTWGLYSWASGSLKVCALPTNASDQAYQSYQNCILRNTNRTGGFRCNELNTITREQSCDSFYRVNSPLINPGPGQQACSTNTFANSSSFMQKCCNGSAIAFDTACFQYCVGPDNSTGNSLQECITRELSAANLIIPRVCINGRAANTNGTATSASIGNRVDPLNGSHLAPTLGLVAVLAWAIGYL